MIKNPFVCNKMLTLDPFTTIVYVSIVVFIGYQFRKRPFQRDLVYIFLLIGTVGMLYYIRASGIVTVEKALQEAFDKSDAMKQSPIKEPPSPPRLKNPKTNLVVQGSGAGLIAMAGSLYALRHSDFVKKIKKVAGVSSGSLLVYMVALGYTEEEILGIVYNFNTDSIINRNLYKSITGMWSSCGFYSNGPLRKMVRMLEERKKVPEDYTFKQLKEARGVELYVVAVNINKSETVIFSHENTPNIPIRDAVCASMAVPYFFEPMRIRLKPEGDLDVFVDGGLGVNFPLYVFQNELDKTVGLKITDVYTKRDKQIYYPQFNVTNLANFTMALMLHNFYQLDRLYLDLNENFWNHVIAVPFDSFNTLKFDLTSEEKQKIMQKSFDEAIKQITQENKTNRFESMRLPPNIQGQLQQMKASVRDMQLSPVDTLHALNAGNATQQQQ